MTNKTLIIDCETTIFQDGNPFSKPNRLMCVGTLFNGEYEHHDIEYSGLPYNKSIERLSQLFSQAETVVGFNLKFDLHWIRKYVPDLLLRNTYCCQLTDFILSDQRNAYPSLDKVAAFYNLGSKLDTVRLQYWDNGIDTPDIPMDVLGPYLKGDVLLTKAVYDRQQEIIQELPSNRRSLIQLHQRDLQTLAEAEFNGMLFDTDKASDLAQSTTEEMNNVQRDLRILIPDEGINWNSPTHVSCILYGGTISIPHRVKTERTLKDGTIKVGEKWGTRTVDCSRLVEPLDRTETAREGIYETNQDVLPMLKATGKARTIIKLLLQYANLESLLSKGYVGIPKKQLAMLWEPNTIHGQFNQCVAVTGRLSSSGPNLQNFTGKIKPLFYSRFN